MRDIAIFVKEQVATHFVLQNMSAPVYPLAGIIFNSQVTKVLLS